MSRIRLSLLLIVLATGSFPAIAKPRIDWSAASISQVLIRGTATLQQITFTTSEKLSTVTVDVTPGLARFVSVSPSSFDGVPSGEHRLITVTFNIPENTSSQIIEGTIHIRDGRNTIAQPLGVTLQTAVPSLTDIPTSVALPSSDRIVSLPQDSNLSFVKDELNLFVKPGVTPDQVRALVASVGGTFLGSEPDIGFYQIEIPQEGFEQLATAIGQFSQHTQIDLATLHFFLTSENFPNDPGTDLSYGPDLVKLPQAWDITTGQHSIAMAVVDSVFDFDHKDLRDNVSVRSMNTAEFKSPHHGTRVASIVGAKGNNFEGIAGVMWDASLQLYSTGRYDNARELDSSLMIIAFSKAIRDGARVLNLSWARTVRISHVRRKRNNTSNRLTIRLSISFNSGDTD